MANKIKHICTKKDGILKNEGNMLIKKEEEMSFYTY